MVALTVVDHQEDGRVYEGLPVGIRPWTAFGASTGNGSGSMGLQIEFNPGSVRGFVQYVSICHIGVDIQTAGVSDAWEGLINGANWEKAPTGSLHFATMPNVRTLSATELNAVYSDVFYCGRVKAGTAGLLTIRADDTTSAVAQIGASGFISDRPFVAHYDWRV